MMKYPKLSPSALFLITFVTALFLSWVQPWQLSLHIDHEIIRLTGVVFLLTSLILNILAYREFKKSLTPHAPFATPKVLMQKGVFTLSRNPVYLALVLSQFGFGFVVNSVWLLLGSLILLTVLHYDVIADEEKILESIFKNDYARYKQHTRRWL